MLKLVHSKTFSATKSSKFPVLKNKHVIVLDEQIEGNERQRLFELIIKAFKGNQNSIYYVKNKMFINLFKFEVKEPKSNKMPIVILSSYQDNGTRGQYLNTNKIETPFDFIAEMTEALTYICQQKVKTLPMIDGELVTKCF
ncbi:Hypothetical_protein [Hexamita inflata]|uniref:Hypothetical_protein n=1 Tax=Hexamita inflata TaxID=28002 RepID=A0AA86PPL3_9EUKA|nr:Hypothetical protein HINF_LOCUS28718 [Hexamita inflata]